MKSVIATNVRRIINEQGLKQYAVAKKAGYSLQSFNNMLNGRKRITDIDVAILATALGVEPNALFAIEEEM